MIWKNSNATYYKPKVMPKTISKYKKNKVFGIKFGQIDTFVVTCSKIYNHKDSAKFYTVKVESINANQKAPLSLNQNCP